MGQINQAIKVDKVIENFNIKNLYRNQKKKFNIIEKAHIKQRLILNEND